MAMKCENAQDAVMLYHEKRLKPFKSFALYRHIHKCADCRELFLAMEDLSELNAETNAPDNFTDMVMAKVAKLPAYEVLPKNSGTDWLYLAACAYALLLAIGFSVLYQVDYYVSLPTNEYVSAFLDTLSQIGSQAAAYATSTLSDFGLYFLILTVVLGLALALVIQKEKSKT